MVILPHGEKPFKDIKDLPETQRNKQGFGSTGANAVVLKKEIKELEHSKEKLDKHSYQLGPKLTPKEKEALTSLIGRYEDVLAVDFEDIVTLCVLLVYKLGTRGQSQKEIYRWYLQGRG